MNKKEAIKYMISRVEGIEREHLAVTTSTDASKFKKEVVDEIIKALNEMGFEDENQPN